MHVRRLVSDPRFYYLIAYFDKKTMSFRDPLFLVPSSEVHKHAMPRIIGQRWHFTFQASLKPGARDYFSRFRETRADAGRVLLRIIREPERLQTTRANDTVLPNVKGVLWVHTRQPVAAQNRRRREVSTVANLWLAGRESYFN